MLAIIPLVAFFGFGVLSKDDFNGFLWNVVMLAMGGLTLGEAVQSSGLLAAISQVGRGRGSLGQGKRQFGAGEGAVWGRGRDRESGSSPLHTTLWSICPDRQWLPGTC